MLGDHSHKGGPGQCDQAQQTHKSVSSVLDLNINKPRWKEDSYVKLCSLTERFCLLEVLTVETVPILLRQPVLAILNKQIKA